MIIEEYFAKLAQLDVKLWLDGEKLRLNAPDGVLTAELRAELTARKPEIVDFLSRVQAGSAEQAAPLKPAPAGTEIPLTLAQERIWSLSKLDAASSVYNVPTVFHLSGEFDVAALERALNAVLERHGVLRAAFPGDDAASARQVVSPFAPVSIPVSAVGRDLARLPADKGRRALHGLLHDEAAKPFDLARGPLWRVRLFRLNPREHVLAFTMHHIIFDGVSKVIFMDELAAEYRAAVAGEPSPFEKPQVQFADFAVWQRARLDDASLKRQLGYWEQRLSGDVPELLIPYEKPRAAGKGRAGSVHFQLPAPLTQALVQLGQREQASLFVVLLAAFDIVLHGYTGQGELIVVAPMASRDKAEIERMLGYFNNVVAVRADLRGNPSVRELIAQLRRLAVDAFDNQYVPLQQVAQLPNLVRTPLTRAMFSFQDTSTRELDLAGVKAKPLKVRKDDADFDLAFYTERDGDTISGVLDFNADIFGAERVKRILQRFMHVLDMMKADPERRLSDFPSYGRPLAEVEAYLAAHPQIEQAVLVTQPHSGQLVAYLVLNEHDVPDLQAIRAYAAKSLPAFRVPVAFIPLDEMPLLPDGSVDKAALPPPATDRSRLATEYAPPRNELETSLADIWKKVLWLDHDVGIHDRFRDLGGHSLLSVQLVVEIEKTLQRPVPARALATLNTVAELAAALEAGDGGDTAVALAGGGSVLPQELYHGLRSHTASWEGKRSSPESVMVGLNTAGSGQALFWCLQRYQELTQLARYLGEDQPVYGMRSGNRVMIKTQDNIDLLARHYVGEILAVQPQGPYLIGGNCQAASIALSIAMQLRELGHEITLLVMQERFAPLRYDGPVALLFGDHSDFNPYRYFVQPERGWRKYYRGPVAMSEIRGGHGQFFREPNVQVLTAAIKKYVAQAQAGTFADDPPRTGASTLQVLPPEAYRAQLAGQAPKVSALGTTARLRVLVANRSAVEWAATPDSGVDVANGWADPAGQVHQWIDGRAALTQAVPPGATAEVELTVKAPARKGRWVLVIDLVDEGIAWFKDQG